jgi:hypothetical protein
VDHLSSRMASYRPSSSFLAGPQRLQLFQGAAGGQAPPPASSSSRLPLGAGPRISSASSRSCRDWQPSQAASSSLTNYSLCMWDISMVRPKFSEIWKEAVPPDLRQNEGGSSYFLLILGIQTQCNNRGFALRRAGTEYRPASQTFCRRKVAADRPI